MSSKPSHPPLLNRFLCSCPPLARSSCGLHDFALMQASGVAFTGFKFEVHPSFFMVHRPHTPSPALKLFWGEKDKQGSIWKKVEDLYKVSRAALRVERRGRGGGVSRSPPGVVGGGEGLWDLPEKGRRQSEG